MNLMQLKPRESSFSLKSVERTFRMNRITLADEVWLDQEFGISGLQEMFTEINMSEIARVAFRFIHPEDKKFFKTREVLFITENGDEEVVMLGGVALLRNLISGTDEKTDIINALLDNIGISRPEPEVEAVKKKVIKKKVAKKKASKKK